MNGLSGITSNVIHSPPGSPMSLMSNLFMILIIAALLSYIAYKYWKRQKNLEKLGFKGVSDDLEGINDKMKEKAVLLTDNGKKAASLGDMFKIMGTGISGLFSSLKDALTDPLSILTMIIKAVQFLLGIFNHVLKVTNQVGLL